MPAGQTAPLARLTALLAESVKRALPQQQDKSKLPNFDRFMHMYQGASQQGRTNMKKLAANSTNLSGSLRSLFDNTTKRKSSVSSLKTGLNIRL